MMNNTLKRFLSGLVLFFFFTANIFARDMAAIAAAAEKFRIVFGGTHYFHDTARTVMEAKERGDIGGVMFQAVAEPEDPGLKNQGITLSYDDKRADGERLGVTISGGQEIVVKGLYDFMLLPTANFAESDSYTCMTLLDTPKNQAETNLHKTDLNDGKKNVYFAAYHPAFGNTLIGLNAYLLDAALMDFEICGFTRILPRLEGYNEDEWYNDDEPNSEHNRRMDIISADHAYRIDVILWDNDNYSNYIYSDDGVHIRFRIEDDQIRFSGAPYYQFVATIPKLPGDYDKAEDIVRMDLALNDSNGKKTIEKVIQRMSKEAIMTRATEIIEAKRQEFIREGLQNEVINMGRQDNNVTLAEMTEAEVKAILRRLLPEEEEILQQIEALNENEAKESLKSIILGFVGYLSLDNMEDIKSVIEAWINIKSIAEAWIETLPYDVALAKSEQVLDQITPTSHIASDPELVRGLNPVIFDTAEQTAQWASFFRFVMENNPAAWANFMGQIKAKILPNKDDEGYQYMLDTNYQIDTPRRFHTK